MITNEHIFLIGVLGTISLVIFFLLILFCSKQRMKGTRMKNKKESWYSDEKGRELDKGTLISLYKIYHDYMGESLNRHFNVRNYYTVLLSALSGLYIGGILQLAVANINVAKWSMLHLLLLTPPVAVIVLSLLAIGSTTRYYSAFLRRVVLVAKIENMLGIDSQVRNKKVERPRDLIWEEDEKFMVKYYWESRKAFKCSKQFIKKKKWKGDNQWALVTFVSFIGIGVFLLILHLLV